MRALFSIRKQTLSQWCTQPPLRCFVSFNDAVQNYKYDYYFKRGTIVDHVLLDHWHNIPNAKLTAEIDAELAAGDAIDALTLGDTFNLKPGIRAGHASIGQMLRYQHIDKPLRVVQTDIAKLTESYGLVSSLRILEHMGRWRTLFGQVGERALFNVELEPATESRWLDKHQAKLMMASYDMTDDLAPDKLRAVTQIKSYRWIMATAILCHCDNLQALTCGSLTPSVDAMVRFLQTHIIPQLEVGRGQAILTGRRLITEQGMAEHKLSKWAVIEAADRLNDLGLTVRAEVSGVTDALTDPCYVDRPLLDRGSGFELRLFHPLQAADKKRADETEVIDQYKPVSATQR